MNNTNIELKTLTVRELIEILQKQPQSNKIVVASDPEGNQYGVLSNEIYSIENAKTHNNEDITIIFPIDNISSEDLISLESDSLMN